jgi:hypothetical protein
MTRSRHWVLGIRHLNKFANAASFIPIVFVRSGRAIGNRQGCVFIVSVLLMIMCFFQGRAQDVKVNGGFLSDSLKIGEQTAFYLSAHYPSTLTILFPDSSFAFTPFEYQKRNYFPTRSANGISVDSAVYYLTTFEVDRVQSLTLPVYIVQPQDCTAVDSPPDSVLITQMVAKMPDSLSVDKLPLKMNTAYQKVFFEFNFWVVLIAVGVLLVLATVVWIFFGKRIRQYFRVRSLKKQHEQFVRTYSSTVGQLQSAFSALTTENAVSLWKKYMEQLEARPYTKLTTKETLHLIDDESLIKNLRTIDTAIYGHSTSVYDSLNYLKNFADERFTKKIEEVNHGK